MSRRKDARWGVVYNYVDPINMDYDDFTFSGWEKLLDRAESFLNLHPELEGRYYDYFHQRCS